MSESASGEADSGKSGTDNNSTECPTCGLVCKSVKGMRRHHKIAHDEKLGYIEITCRVCGTKKDRHESTLDGSGRYYCSSDCQHEGMKDLRGKHPNNEKILVGCANCGDEKKVPPSRVKSHDRHFCSQKCMGEYRSESYAGENSHRWRGGYDKYYGPNWKKQRRKARERDNYKCQDCGIKESEYRKELSVHHITRAMYYKRNYDDPEWYERANRLDNLITFCESCHSKWEGIPLRPDNS